MEPFFNPDVALAAATGDPFTAQDFIPPDGGEGGADFVTDFGSPTAIQRALGFDVPPGTVALGPGASLIDPDTGAPLPVADLFYDLESKQVMTAAGLPVPFAFGPPTPVPAPPAAPAAAKTPADVAREKAALEGELKAIALDAENKKRAALGLPPLPEGTAPGLFSSPTARLIAGLGLGAAGIGTSALLASGGRKPPIPATGRTAEQAVGKAALSRALTVPSGGAALDRVLGVPGPVAGPGEGFFDLDTGQIVSGPAPGSGAADLEAIVRENLAGQRALSRLLAQSASRELSIEQEQAPAERLLRTSALADVPLFQAQPFPEAADPIRAGLEGRLLRVLGGDFASKSLERRIKQSEAQLRARLFQQLGPAYELSTPGQQALAGFNQSAEELRQDEERREIAALTSPEESRRRFAEGVRGRGFEERLTLTGLGRRPTTQLLTGFQGMVPAAPLLGIESEAGQRAREALQFQSALSGFESEQAGRRALAQSTGNLFGLGASRLLFA